MADLITWLSAHQAIEAALGIAIIDLIFALKPSWKSNGVFHWVYQQLGGKA